MEDLPIVKRAVDEILKPLAARNINAVIAGGFVRDAVLGRPYRDVDLYVADSHAETAHEVLGVAEPDDVAFLDDMDDEYRHQSVASQYEVQSPVLGGCTINFVRLHGRWDQITPQIVTSRFNLGICMAAANVNEVYLAPEFWADATDERITLLRTDWGHESSLRQWVKLQAKYPWPLRMGAAA